MRAWLFWLAGCSVRPPTDVPQVDSRVLVDLEADDPIHTFVLDDSVPLEGWSHAMRLEEGTTSKRESDRVEGQYRMPRPRVRVRVVGELVANPPALSVIAAKSYVPARRVIEWAARRGGAIVARDSERTGVLRLHFTPYLKLAEPMEVHLSMESITITASAIYITDPHDHEALASALVTARQLYGYDAPVALHVDDDVDTQQLATAIAALDLAGERIIGLATVDP